LGFGFGSDMQLNSVTVRASSSSSLAASQHVDAVGAIISVKEIKYIE
jgi:hypothetical protein